MTSSRTVKDVSSTTDIASLGHVYTGKYGAVKTPSTKCTEKTIHYYSCIRSGCGVNAGSGQPGSMPYGQTYEGSAIGHSYTSQYQTSAYIVPGLEGNCVTRAHYYYKCAWCSAKGTGTYEGGYGGHGRTPVYAIDTSAAFITKSEAVFNSPGSRIQETDPTTLATKMGNNAGVSFATVSQIAAPETQTFCTIDWKYQYKTNDIATGESEAAKIAELRAGNTPGDSRTYSLVYNYILSIKHISGTVFNNWGSSDNPAGYIWGIGTKTTTMHQVTPDRYTPGSVLREYWGKTSTVSSRVESYKCPYCGVAVQ